MVRLTYNIHVHVSFFGSRGEKFECSRFASIEMSDSLTDKLAFFCRPLVTGQLRRAGPEGRTLHGLLGGETGALLGRLVAVGAGGGVAGGGVGGGLEVGGDPVGPVAGGHRLLIRLRGHFCVERRPSL